MAIRTQTFSTGDYAWHSWSNGYGISLTLTQEYTNSATNTSLVSYLFTISNTNNNRFIANDCSWTISIGGQSIAIDHFNFDLSADYTTQTIAAGQVTVAHNASGALDMPYSVSVPNIQEWNRYGPPAMLLSGNWPLEGIPRGAAIITAPDCNDGAIPPKITYSNPAGLAVSSLRAGITDLSGTTVYVSDRDLPPMGTSYTFSLRDEELSALRNAMPNRNAMDIRIVLSTVLGGAVYQDSAVTTFRIVDAAPLLSATVLDTNSHTLALTGDENTLVRFASNATVTANYSPQKGASIQSFRVQNAGRQRNYTPCTFTAVEQGMFLLRVTDSRGNRTELSIEKTVIPYVKLTCNLSDNKPDAEGNVDIVVSGNFFNGSFGVEANELTVQYRYKAGDGAWQQWNAIPTTIADNTYTARTQVTGSNYQTAYTFQARAVDRLDNVNSVKYTARALPVFDWGENDFNVNGTLKINGLVQGVTEEGIEGNWYYRKLANGMAECSCKATLQHTNVTPRALYTALVLPFSLSPIVSAHVTQEGLAGLSSGEVSTPMVYFTSENNLDIYLKKPTEYANTDQADVYVTVKGFWKNTADDTTAVLGLAVLGKMILGKGE